MDLNQRPLGYEPNELPGCSIPRCNMTNKLAEKEGFEPPRRRRPPGFQDRSLQPDLGISPKSRIIYLKFKMVPKAGIEPARDLTPAGF